MTTKNPICCHRAHIPYFFLVHYIRSETPPNMRLGQLSRQLEVSSDQIVRLLAKQFREVNNHPNIKLTEEELEFVVDHFRPVVDETVEVSEPHEELPVVVTPEADTPTPEAPESTPEFVEELKPQVITLEEEFNSQKEDLESFKAEKPNLEGLKVVGKIELPEPVVKEKKANEEVDENDDRESNRARGRQRRDKRNRSNRNSVSSPAAERQKAERLAKKKKYEQEKRQKELKKKHYEQNVKAKLPHKPSKKKKKKAFVESQGPSPSPNQQKSQHKAAKKAGPLKRFWLWLNGAYDRFD